MSDTPRTEALREVVGGASTRMVVTLVIIVLVLINTLYVAAEFSAVSVRRSRLEELARNEIARLDS